MKDLVKIKNSLDNLIQEAYLTDDKTQLKTVFDELKDNRDLQVLYYCINNLQNPPKINESEIKDFIAVNVKLAKEIDTTKFQSLTAKLSDVDLSEKDKSINQVLFESENAFNFLEHSKAKSIIFESIKEKNKNFDIDLNQFPVEDVEFVKNIINNPEPVFQSLCKECLDVLDQKLADETNLNTKLLIYETREKILQSQINFKFSPENVIEILNLKEDLLKS